MGNHKFMTRLTAIICALATLSFTAKAQVVFDDVNVLNIEHGTVDEHQRVVVDGDRIIAVGSKSVISIPSGARVVDASGKYLMPGLGEMHGHIPPITSGKQAIADTLFLYVSNGVTTVRGMLGSEGQLELRKQANSGEITAPTLYLAGPSFNGNSVTSPEQASAKVLKQVDESWDLLKVHPGLTLPEYQAMAKTANEAGIEFGGHIPDQVGLLNALSVSQRTIDHLDGYIPFVEGAHKLADDAKLVEAAKLTREARVGVVPTIALWKVLLRADNLDRLKALPELKYMPKATREGWINYYKQPQNIAFLRGSAPEIRHQNRLKLLKVLSDEGVEILFGTDAPQVFSVPGFSIHNEMATMQEAGMTPQEILKSATLAVGNYFKTKDRFGQVRAGYRADLILLNGNPLTDLEYMKNPAGVVQRGHWLDRKTIDTELAAIEARYK
ncbi:amidohydrolase family protein [Kordiimonas sp. SCSIO 12610]|uniref:amidohydrolase family protein n=1 Tax=Kordiimonas sp. SCSIO 12610 TaxID=2829597 RepID=UPI00210BDE20|nr:amidohydrolase family protein [Kordiimonas sp. SCSIO 12610]UTW55761.1 amidohydrolase family protein [Kordiimonas sp. SCSIO 12610]